MLNLDQSCSMPVILVSFVTPDKYCQEYETIWNFETDAVDIAAK